MRICTVVIQSKVSWKQSSKFKGKNRFSMNPVHFYISILTTFFFVLGDIQREDTQNKSTKK